MVSFLSQDSLLSLLASCKNFLFKLMAACLFFGLVITALLLLLFFSSPDLPEVTLTSLTVMKFNSTRDHISGYWNMQFDVVNPILDTEFFYNDVYCSLYYGKHRLATTVFPGFGHTAKETEQMNITVHLTPETTATGIHNDLATYGFAKFDVKLATIIKWVFWSFKSIRVSCDGVAVGLLPAAGGYGKMIGPAMICGVLMS